MRSTESLLQPRRPPLLLPLLLWQINAAAAASSTVQCDVGIIVACTLGTFGGCALLLAVAALVRWVRSRRRRRAMFEGQPMIRSYSKLLRGTDNVAFANDATARSGSAGVGMSGQPDEASRTTAAKQAHGRLLAVDLISKDIIGLGLAIQGTYTDGIFISEVHDRGPAKGTGLVEVGDRIMSLTISTENMAYEDALALLSYATPYRVTVQLLKHGSSIAAGGSRDTRLLRKKDRDSMATAATRDTSAGSAGMQPLRHPAFFGRSQSMDESLVNSCLPRPGRSMPLLMSLGLPGSSQAKTVIPPPKPKRSMDSSRVDGSSSSSSSSGGIMPTTAATSRPMQLLSPLEPVAATAAAARLHEAADIGVGGSTPIEEPLSTVTIKPVSMSADRLFSVADSPTAQTAESSLLEDINRVLSRERHELALPLERQESSASIEDTSQPEETMYGEGEEVPDELYYDWEVYSNVSTEQVDSAVAYIRPQGSPPPAYATTNIASRSQLQPAATAAAAADVQKAATTAAAHQGQQVGGEIHAGDLLLSTIDVSMPLAAAKELQQNSTDDDGSECTSSDLPSFAGDEACENDGRTSTPIRNGLASPWLALGSAASLEPSEGAATAHELPTALGERTVGHVPPKLPNGMPRQPSSRPAPPLDGSSTDGGTGHATLSATAVARPLFASSSSKSFADSKGLELCAAADSHQSGRDGIEIVVTIQREAAAAAAKPNRAIGPGNGSSEDGESLPPPAEQSSLDEANGFNWTADDHHFAARRISSETTTSGDSDPKSSDSSMGAIRTRGSDDEVTPKPLRKFGNFANLSHDDELDAADSSFFDHMADRESVSSEYSTPVQSEHGNESPKAFTSSGVDENLNQALKLATGQVGGQRPPAQPVAEIGGTSKRSVEEARALFFAEMLQRSTH